MLVAPAADPARAHERFVGGTTVSSRADAWEGQRIMTIAGERSPSTPPFGAASSASSYHDTVTVALPAHHAVQATT